MEEKRIFLLSKGAFDNPVIAHVDATNFFSVMLYPENTPKQNEYLLSVDACFAERVANEEIGFTAEEMTEFWAEHGRQAGKLLLKKDHFRQVALQAFTSRKSGELGTPARRGFLVGEILSRLLKPSVGSLRRAYQEMINGDRYHLHDETRLNVPSESTLQKIWEDYKTVAPFWAATHAIGEEQFKSLFVDGPLTSTAINLESAKILKEFLQAAEFFRRSLLKAIVPSTKMPLIPEEIRPYVWQVLDEEKNEIPPIEISIH